MANRNAQRVRVAELDGAIRLGSPRCWNSQHWGLDSDLHRLDSSSQRLTRRFGEFYVNSNQERPVQLPECSTKRAWSGRAGRPATIRFRYADRICGPDTSGHQRSAREHRFDRANRSPSFCGALPGAQVSTLRWSGLPTGHEDRADIARGGRCASAVHYQVNLPVVWARGTVRSCDVLRLSRR